MSTTDPALSDAFHSLERALARRRLDSIEWRLRLELGALATLIAGFCGWQLRNPLDHAAHFESMSAFFALLGGVGIALALGSAWLAGTRHARRLRGPAPGPAWLALPIPPRAIERHFARDARGARWWVGVPGVGAITACAGLVPWPWLLVLFGALAALLAGSAWLGCRVAYLTIARAAAHAQPQSPGGTRRVHPMERLLAAAPLHAGRVRGSVARWTRRPAWRALWLKDLAVSRRATPARRRAVGALALVVASALVWRLPVDPRLARLIAFGLALTAAAALGEWWIALAGSDPFGVLRVLPIGVASVWGARFAWVLAGAALLDALHALAAPPLPAHSVALFLVWVGGAALAIGALGANYGVTLYPHADVAGRMLGLSLALAVAASLMIPLMGWVLLLAAVFHSARRLPRWWALEER